LKTTDLHQYLDLKQMDTKRLLNLLRKFRFHYSDWDRDTREAREPNKPEMQLRVELATREHVRKKSSGIPYSSRRSCYWLKDRPLDKGEKKLREYKERMKAKRKEEKMIRGFSDKDFYAMPEVQLLRDLEGLAARTGLEEPEFRLIGGFVRDTLLSHLGQVRIPHDKDIVTNADPDTLEAMGLTRIDAKFPVYLFKTDGESHEIACCRTERKTGNKHSDFEAVPCKSFEDDAMRRDLTVNTISITSAGNIISYHPWALSDLSSKILRHVSDAFWEDPLRVLRAARFSAQLGPRWTVSKESLEFMIRGFELVNHVPPSRVKMEMEKAFVSNHPSQFFRTMAEIDPAHEVMPFITARVAYTLDHIKANIRTMYTILFLEKAWTPKNVDLWGATKKQQLDWMWTHELPPFIKNWESRDVKDLVNFSKRFRNYVEEDFDGLAQAIDLYSVGAIESVVVFFNLMAFLNNFRPVNLPITGIPQEVQRQKEEACFQFIQEQQ
jgi:hypothetical protein